MILLLEHELKSWHEKLSHPHTKSMFRLEKLGVILSRFLDLKDDLPLCESCMFGTASIRKRIVKVNNPVSTNKETENKTGAGVSVY